MFNLCKLPGLFLFLICSTAQASAPAGENWLTLSTPNFRVHHTAPLSIYAKHFAYALEKNLPALEQRLRWKAPTPIDIVVMDPSDSANGLAMNFPSTRMEVYASPFEVDTSLSHYFNWVNELAVHELTHIIANDSALGFYLTLRSIFGSWVKPNGLQPLWLVEGLAVYQETSLSEGGRGRSPWLESTLRSAMGSKSLTSSDYLSLDRFNDGNSWWPGGATPYLMGYTIQSMATKNLTDLPGEISITNAGQFPFMPNTALEKVQGKDWFHIWNRAPSTLAGRFPSYSNSFCALTKSGNATGGHALSADGWIYFSEENFERGSWISRVRADAPCNEAEVERLMHREFGGPAQVAVSADGKYLAFSKFDNHSFERLWADLYIYEIERGTVDQLTKNARAKDPAFRGEHLYYVAQTSDTRQAIRSQHLQNKTEAEVFSSLPLERISGLFADDKGILFSLHNNKGSERIFAIDLSSAPSSVPAKISAIMPEPKVLPHFERHPYRQSDGKILYSLFQKGKAKQDLYSFDPKNGKSQPLATSDSGFLDRAIPYKNELIAMAFTPKGFQIAKVVPSNFSPQEQSQDLHEFLSGEKPADSPRATEAELTSLGEVKPYSATSTTATSLWPQYWLPEISAAEEGTLLGASTTGNDALDYHSYGLMAQYDTRAKFPLYRAFYTNRVFKSAFHVEVKQSNNFFASSKSSNRSNLYMAETIIPWHKWYFILGGAYQKQSLFGRNSQSAIAFQNISIDETGKSPAAIYANHGYLLNLYSGIYPTTKGEKTFADIRPKFGFYLRGILPSHGMGLTAQAGITTNKLLVSNYYTGGGLSPLTTQNFVVRGYPVDSLLGQKIATVNARYTLPLFHPYRGLGTHPFFLESIGLSFHGDMGTANFVAVHENGVFRRYTPEKVGKLILPGYGVDIVTNGSFFYHAPYSLVTGLHYGSKKQYGGDLLLYLAFNVGLSSPGAR